MKQVIVHSRKELEKMLDALDLTEQYYEIKKNFYMKETGLTSTTEIKTAWLVVFGDEPEEESEQERIGFKIEDIEEEYEDEEEYEQEEF